VIIEPDRGVVQGAVVSPLLSNVYVHSALDLWAHQWRRRHAQGAVIILRYADAAVVGFPHRHDAEQFLTALQDRLATFALQLHPEQTRLSEFGRYAARSRVSRGQERPETFTFLGFTHICSTSRNGKCQRRRHTSKKRMRAKLTEIKDTLRRHWHKPIADQGAWLCSVLRGDYAYHAVPLHGRRLEALREQVKWRWLRALRRRSQRHRMTWERVVRLARRWLPHPRILHPWPDARFAVKHPR
jgi:RNA-directed DNA polymerase